jgi:protein-S-isoprenylcysteine O-methyltransferase Ste14
MEPLYRQAIKRSLFGSIVFLILIFLPAGTLAYWQGWVFFAVFGSSTTAFTIYLALYDKPLLERRLKSGPSNEPEKSQKVIITLVLATFVASIVLPVLDHRFGYSPVSPIVSLIGDAIVVFSFLGIFWVIKVNSWAASNVRVEAGQQVIDTGPYAHVRHPMYAFAIWIFVGIPLALGSWWSVLLIVPFLPILLWRLLDEERILRRDLPGYEEYTQRVRARLIPRLW